MKRIYLVILLSFSFSTAFSQTTIFPLGSDWNYKDDGSDQGTSWKNFSFNDSGWQNGSGQLGYGDGDETTILNACGTPTQFPTCAEKYITYYFRKTFDIPDVAIFRSFIFEMLRDDGVVIYVNGTEVYRDNMPGGTISYSTLATQNAPNDGNSITSVTLSLASSLLQSGNNVIAVEIHQATASSSDLTWDMKLSGIPLDFPFLTLGPYLQKATPNSVLVRWYTDVASDSRVTYGTDPGNLSETVYLGSSTTNHSVQITGLAPYTKYYYSIGSSTVTLQSGVDNYFLTPPSPGATGKYTFWATGDVGNGSARQFAVRDQYYSYIGNGVTNGYLLLGDNAYNYGTVDAYTNNFFGVYQDDILRKTILWPATGNHEYANSSARQIDHNIPYFDFFDLPTGGESGGIPSGSEAYYSYDYGNIHFVALDSYIIESSTYRLYDTLGPQVQWLKQDLAANNKDWTIVYFHHPPYTMGSHNSDTENELIKIRENLVRILERYDVDLVLSGHSHDYERSKLMEGHYGYEASFDPLVHDVSQSSGKYNGTSNSCLYTKDSPVSSGGTIYVVAGSGGQLDPGQINFPHDAMYYGSETIGGSLVIEIENNRLDLKWLSEDGVIRDNFTMMKEVNRTNDINLISGQSVKLDASWIGQYAWSTSQTSQSITVSPTSSQSYTVSDQYGCITDAFNVNVIGGSISLNIPSVGFSQICVGENVDISYTASGTFSVDNIFTLQLSDGSGNFSNPTILGTVAGTASGSIGGVIPTNLVTGNNYRFRVISSNPVYNGSQSASFSINALPVVTAPASICIGSPITIIPSTGGSWVSSNNSVATITNSGVVTGISTGTVKFTFTNSTTGCSSETGTVTVNAIPTAPSVVNLSYCKDVTANQLTATAASGHALQWYGTNATGGIASTTAPTPSTSSVGATTYYVSQKNNVTGCEGPRAGTTVTINASPNAPAVSNVTYCRTETASQLTATATSGHTLQWYGMNATGGTASTTAPTPSTSTVGTTTYYVSQKNNTTGCEGPRAGILVTVNALPSAPTVANVSYCKDETASQLTATATSGHTLQWYGTNATGGTASTTAPTPSTSIVGNTTYYVSQKNNTTGCEGPRVGITVTINAIPNTPTVSSITYCEGATASQLTATATSGHTLQWYGTNPTGGTASTNAPTPSTSTVGSTTYYVSQKNNTTGCEGPRAGITVTVNATPNTPTVSNITYCRTETASQLTATAASGHSLQWYGTNATGGTASTTAPTPSTSTVGTTTYYVSQKNNTSGCEGPRAGIVVTVNALPSAPTVANISYCKDETASQLTAAAISGHTLQWYGTNATGGTASTTAPTPSTSTVGTTTFYVSQKNNTTGCEGPRAGIVVAINALPSPPTVANVSYCENATASQLTATVTSGHTLQWYGTNATGGTASTTAPTPSTSTVGTTTYYVSQKNNTSGCEGLRAGITVTVTAAPNAPTVSNITYCRNETSSQLIATAASGHTLQWYGTNATEGTASTTAPTPSTSTVGSTTYYVSQKNNTSGCEGPRAGIVVTINALPSAPTIANVSYCKEETASQLTATASSGHTLQWYGTNASGGTASSTAPTPTTSAVGTTTYYVSQKNNTTGCEGPRAGITVIVNALPNAPSVSNVSYCKGSTPNQLTATVTSGHTLQWYGTNATGGTASTTAPTPSTNTAGNTSYYVSQKNNTTGCEGPRAGITVTVNEIPSSPIVSDVFYCLNSTATQLTAQAEIGHTLYWYGTNSTGGTSSISAPTPSTNSISTTNYYVSQVNDNSGCESSRSKITVSVNSLPVSPVVSDKAYCQNSTASQLTATASVGFTLIWYGTDATGGTPSSTAPTPSTNVVGSTDYYVSQVNLAGGCDGESERAKITVVINQVPTSPSVTDATYCLNETATELLASPSAGNILLWYGTNATGGNSSLTPPIPSTSAAGVKNYYVSQKNSDQCESERANIVVTINSSPKPIITATGLGTANIKLKSSSSSGNQWFVDGNEINGATSNEFFVIENGLYQVQTTTEGCISELSEPVNVVITAIEDLPQITSISLFPVPARNTVTIYISGVNDQDVTEIEVFDLLGRRVDNQMIRGNAGSLAIENYPIGDYFVRAKIKSYLFNARLVKY